MSYSPEEPLAKRSHLHEQIELIGRHEQDFQHRRTRSERLGDILGGVIGSLVRGFPRMWDRHMDSAECPSRHSSFRSAPLSIAGYHCCHRSNLFGELHSNGQGRMNRRADERDHLILQILILTEREITAVLRLEQELASEMGLKTAADDETLRQMSQDTEIDEITMQVQEKLSDS
jgi:hypothetical protein